MSNVASKYRVGVFVFVGMVLIVISFIMLGALKYFEPQKELVTAVRASVQGLETGAKVKYKGVTIGKVVKIDLDPADDTVWIFMTLAPGKGIYKDRFETFDKWSDHLRKNIGKMVEEGLRCQLRYEGITGNLYLEIDRFDPAKHPVDATISVPEDFPLYLPSIPPVTMDNILDKIERSLDEIAKLDLRGISKDMRELLTAGKGILDKEAIDKILTDVQKTSSNLEEITNTINTAFSPEKVEKIREDLSKTIQNLNQTLEDVSSTREDFEGALGQAEKTLRSARRLMEYIEKNPESIIYGKSDEPVVPVKE